jgi:hypothetical protein
MKLITRRESALLISKSIAAAPVLGLSSRIGHDDMPASVYESAAVRENDSGAPVYVVLWFDTEDYILPKSDDAAKRIALFLLSQGIRATFKLVGEKARVLTARNRSDVILALSRHEIGYHSNTHSQHPTIAEYEAPLDWSEGVEEFDRRERGGFDDIHRIFGYAPTCFGQPGVSWAPQAYAALKKWGVRVYLDDGQHVQLGGKPFWYGGLLNIFGIDAGRGLEPNDDWSNLDSAKSYFRTLYTQLRAQPGGGLVSFMFHPTQFVSQRFWDAVNFSRGANPPRSEWKLQPEASPLQQDQAFRYLESLIIFMKSFPNVQFITATQAFSLYRDEANERNFGAEDLAEIARRVGRSITFQVYDRYSLSASEVFALLNSFVAAVISNKSPSPITLHGTPYGPFSAGYGLATDDSNEVFWSQFSRTVSDVQDYLDINHSIPNVIWLGSNAISPESYLSTLSTIIPLFLGNHRLPERIAILPAELTSRRWVARDSAAIWDWPIFPAGFHAPHLMEMAALQAWTIKPAIMLPAEYLNTGRLLDTDDRLCRIGGEHAPSQNMQQLA